MFDWNVDNEIDDADCCSTVETSQIIASYLDEINDRSNEITTAMFNNRGEELRGLGIDKEFFNNALKKLVNVVKQNLIFKMYYKNRLPINYSFIDTLRAYSEVMQDEAKNIEIPAFQVYKNNFMEYNGGMKEYIRNMLILGLKSQNEDKELFEKYKITVRYILEKPVEVFIMTYYEKILSEEGDD